MRRVARVVGIDLGVGLVMLVVAVVTTWPLSEHLATYVPGDLGDPLENAWIFAWGGHAIVEQPRALFHANMFFPSRFSLAFAENMLGLSVPLAPLLWVTDNGVLVVNVAILLVLAVAGWAVYRLVLALGDSGPAAVVAGIAFTVLPYRVSAVAHVHVLAVHLLPIAVLIVWHVARTTGRRWPYAIALAVVLSAQLWGSLTGGMLTLAATGVAAVWLVAVRGRGALPGLAAVGAGLIGAVALASPALLAYGHARDQNPEYGHPDIEVVQNSATWSSYAFPSVGGAFVDEVYDDLAGAMRPAHAPQEKPLFPGFVLSAAMIGAAAVTIVSFARRRGPLAALSLAWAIALAGLLLSFGPRWGAREGGFPLPFALVEAIVPGGLTRVPARFGVLFLLGGTVAVGVVLARLPDRWRLRVSIVLAVLLVVEAWPSQVAPTRAPSRNAAHSALSGTTRHVVALPMLELTRDGALLFPSVPREAIHMWNSTANFRPLVNGYGAFIPQPYGTTAEVMQDFPTARSLGYLHAIGVDTVIVETALVPGTRWSSASEGLNRWPGIRLLESSGSTEVWDISNATTE